MKTEVCITIDTEFALNRTFVDPDRFSPVGPPYVWCEIDGRSSGLGFLLSLFADFGLAATFFVEALNRTYFGDAMQSIVNHIRADGHDIQLHLHPAWNYFRDPQWRKRLKSYPPSDSFVGRVQQESEELIKTGVETFVDWGIPAPVALRTGGLQVDISVYRAMRKQGLTLASNVGVGVFRPSADELKLYAGLHHIHGVVEVPVLTYRRSLLRGVSTEKALTITGSSWDEMRSLLMAAHSAGVGPIVVLTHPHEYVKFAGGTIDSDRVHINRVNQNRLRCLCTFLAEESGRFEVVTFGGQAERWQRRSPTQNPRFDVSWVSGMKGLAENKLNDWIMSY